VQRQGSAGEQHEIQREQGKKSHEVSNIVSVQDGAAA
jgi:hypothetical protein